MNLLQKCEISRSVKGTLFIGLNHVMVTIILTGKDQSMHVVGIMRNTWLERREMNKFSHSVICNTTISQWKHASKMCTDVSLPIGKMKAKY